MKILRLIPLALGVLALAPAAIIVAILTRSTAAPRALRSHWLDGSTERWRDAAPGICAYLP